MEIDLSPRAAEITTSARLRLAAGGYNSFSYADISADVGISKASIHHHFPSKADLVRTVVLEYRAQAREGMAALEAQVGDPLKQLQAYTGFWSQCIRDGRTSFCIGAMLAAELPSIPEEVAGVVRGHFEDLCAWLTRVLSQGVARGQLYLRADARAEALALMATVHGAMLAARAYGDAAIFDAIIQPHMDRLTSPD